MGRIQGDLKERTFEFAVVILDLVDGLPNTTKGWEISRQLVRSGTGIGANVREADNALTNKEFAQKCSVSRKEASETHYWLQLCLRCKLLRGEAVAKATQEADELTRVLSAVVNRTQRHVVRTRKE